MQKQPSRIVKTRTTWTRTDGTQAEMISEYAPGTVLLRGGQARTHWVGVGSHGSMCGANINRPGWAPRFSDNEVDCKRCLASMRKADAVSDTAAEEAPETPAPEAA